MTCPVGKRDVRFSVWFIGGLFGLVWDLVFCANSWKKTTNLINGCLHAILYEGKMHVVASAWRISKGWRKILGYNTS